MQGTLKVSIVVIVSFYCIILGNDRVFLLRELVCIIFLLHELDLFTTGLHSKEYYDMFTHQ